MSDVIKAEVPVYLEGVELSAKSPEYREYLVEIASEAMNREAAKRGRKISERPRLMDLTTSPLFEGIVYLNFEANTQPI